MDWYPDHPVDDTRPAVARQRLAAIAVGVACIVAALLVAAQAGETAGSAGAAPTAVRAGAVGVTVIVPGTRPERLAAAQPAVDGTASDDAATARYGWPADGSLVVATRVSTRAVVDEPSSASSARATVDELSILGGKVLVRGATLRAHAAISAGRASGGLALGATARLRIDGASVPMTANRQVVVDGVGTISLNEQAVVSNAPTGDRQTGPRYRVVGAIAHIRLTAPYQGLPAGTEIIVGRVDAGVRRGKVVAIAHPPAAPAPASTGSSPGAPLVQAGSPRPGDAGLPRRTTGVAAQGAGPTGNLGGYLFPVLGASSFTDSWGAARASTGVPHQGTDVFATEGTPMVAVADGMLERVGWNTIGGYRLWLHDRFGNSFYYAHLSAYSPIAYDGATVRAGDVIAFVGHTGDAQGTPPHLHFEIHPGDGDAVNPYRYLMAWRKGIAVAISSLGRSSPLDRLPGITLLQAADIAPNSGLASSVLGAVPTAERPIEQENAPVPTDQSLVAAIEGDAISQ